MRIVGKQTDNNNLQQVWQKTKQKTNKQKQRVFSSKTKKILNVTMSLNDNYVTIIIISLSRHCQVCLMRLRFERYHVSPMMEKHLLKLSLSVLVFARITQNFLSAKFNLCEISEKNV